MLDVLQHNLCSFLFGQVKDFALSFGVEPTTELDIFQQNLCSIRQVKDFEQSFGVEL